MSDNELEVDSDALSATLKNRLHVDVSRLTGTRDVDWMSVEVNGERPIFRRHHP